jgi:predicted nucleotidyltransferase
MQSFDKILELSHFISDGYHDVVFIGGVAVYLHLVKRAHGELPPDVSHDADFMISFSDYGALKDAEEITPTARLAKHQMVVSGVEFDIYVERLHRLVIPYDEVFAHSSVIEGIRVACLEHLLVLKLEAFLDRGHSSKGAKDRKDIAKIGLLLGSKFKVDRIRPYVRDELVGQLTDIAKSSLFFELSDNNAHTAKKSRTKFSSFVEAISRLA